MCRDRSQAQLPFGLFFHVLRARSFALRLDSPECRMFPLLASALVPRRAFIPLTTSPDRLRYVPSPTRPVGSLEGIEKRREGGRHPVGAICPGISGLRPPTRICDESPLHHGLYPSLLLVYTMLAGVSTQHAADSPPVRLGAAFAIPSSLLSCSRVPCRDILISEASPGRLGASACREEPAAPPGSRTRVCRSRRSFFPASIDL